MAETAHSAARAAASILIVDDSEASRRLFGDFLAMEGYRVCTAGLGTEATRLAIECRPDLILMDLKLPDACGLAVTRLLKEDTRTQRIPIIAVTARAMAGDARKGLASGCDAYITKPVRLQELLRAVEAFLPAFTTPTAPDRGTSAIR